MGMRNWSSTILAVVFLCASSTYYATIASASMPIVNSESQNTVERLGAKAARISTGTIRVAFVLVRPGGAAHLVTHKRLQSLVFSRHLSVRDQLRQMSYSRARLRGKVFGSWRVSEAAANCAWCLTAAVTKAAKRHGVNLAKFDRIVVIIDNGSSNGLAMLGGRWAWVWTCECGGSTIGRRTLLQRDIVHEIGHTLGVNHAHTRRCTDEAGNPQIMGPVCADTEYGDPYDSMGYSYGANFNTSNRFFLGWLSPLRVTTATADGSFNLSPGSNWSPGVKLLRIPLVTPSTGVVRGYLNIETRQRINYDGSLIAPSAGIWPGAPTTGVLVRFVTTMSVGTWLLDATPATNASQDLPLQPGGSLVDPTSGVTVTLVSESGGYANVTVDFP